MVIKLLVTLDIDEEESRMPASAWKKEEIHEAIHEFVYDIDGMDIKNIRVISE